MTNNVPSWRLWKPDDDASTAALEVAAGPRSGPLDLHEGIGSRGCPRWPRHLRLESTLGERVPGRCKSTNLCEYCAKLAAVENAEVLAWDALNYSAPAVWTVTTTRSGVASMAAYKTARRAVDRAVRREWDHVERATQVEFQTGRGRNAGGLRRPHWNDLWKGVPVADAADLGQVVAGAWCSRIDAHPRGQFAGTIGQAGGLMRYLALHFAKLEQAPPPGWDSHRFVVSRGYLAVPMPAAREAARDALRLRRELWRAERLEGTVDGEQARLGDVLDAVELSEYAEQRHAERSELAWTLVRETQLPTAFDDDDQPTSWSTEWLPV